MTRLQRGIANSGFGEQVPEQNDLDVASKRLSELVRIEDALAGARRKQSGEAAKVGTAKKALTGSVDLDAVPDVSAAALSRTETLLRKRARERAKRGGARTRDRRTRWPQDR